MFQKAGQLSMHAKPRTLLAISLVGGFLLALVSACGGQPPAVCSACTYKTATYTVTGKDLDHGTIARAAMQTQVVHPSCPYAGFNSPCTATLELDVKCLTPGAGSFTIKRRPNGFSAGATAVTTLSLAVDLPGGGTATVPIAVTMGTPDSTAQTAPCGSATNPSISD